MPQSRLVLVRALEGAGTLKVEGHQAPARYSIKIFQEMVDEGNGKEIPGLKSATGQLHDFKAADAARALGRTAHLTLTDGQNIDVILTDLGGAFQVSGTIR